MMNRAAKILLASCFLLPSTGNSITKDQLYSANRLVLHVNAGFQHNRVPKRRTVDSLWSIVDEMYTFRQLPQQVTSLDGWHDQLTTMIAWYQAFLASYNSHCKADSLEEPFRLFSNAFRLLFCDYFMDDTKQRHAIKLLLFSPSVSCECTMRMSMECELLLDSLGAEFGNRVDFVFINTVFKRAHNSAFDVTEVPVIVLLDYQNAEVRRWVREEVEGSQLRVAVQQLL